MACHVYRTIVFSHAACSGRRFLLHLSLCLANSAINLASPSCIDFSLSRFTQPFQDELSDISLSQFPMAQESIVHRRMALIRQAEETLNQKLAKDKQWLRACADSVRVSLQPVPMPVMMKVAVKAAVSTALILINSAQKHDPTVVQQVSWC